jgi:hypothetical protein
MLAEDTVKNASESPLWVIHVRPKRRSASRNVRYASDCNRIDASRRWRRFVNKNSPGFLPDAFK